MSGLHAGAVPAGPRAGVCTPDEPLLQAGDVALELCGVELRILCIELPPLRLGDAGQSKQPPIRGLRRIVCLLHLGAVTFLAHELHDRLKEVGILAQLSIQLVQALEVARTFVACIPHRPARHGIVFLLDEAAVILLVRPPPREGDVLASAVAQ